MESQVSMVCLVEKDLMDLQEKEECLEYKECLERRVIVDGMVSLEKRDSWGHLVQRERKESLDLMDHRDQMDQQVLEEKEAEMVLWDQQE